MVRLVKEATTWTVKLDFTFNKFMRGIIYILDFKNICVDHISIFILEQPNETKSTNFDPSLSKFENKNYDEWVNSVERL